MRLVALLTLVLLLVACGGNDESPSAGATVTPTPATALGGTLVIPSLEIKAPITVKGLEAGVALPSPDGARDVALYDFGGLRGLGGAPGEGGNAVMSGRSISDVGCAPAEPPCNGVFISLARVALGDRIDVAWRGSEYRYQVVSICHVPIAQFGDGIYRRTAQEQITLLTGSGALGPSGFGYVLMVVAQRAPVTAAVPCPEGTTNGAGPR
jgi:sortase (surface protein transpeptidase)